MTRKVRSREFAVGPNRKVCVKWHITRAVVLACILVQATVAWAETHSLEWLQQLGTSDRDYSYSIATDSNNNVYITGYTYGDLDGVTGAGFYAGYYDAFLTKYDSSGVQQWLQQLGTSDHDGGTSVAVDSNNNVYITGYTYGDLDGVTGAGSNAGYSDAFLAKYVIPGPSGPDPCGLGGDAGCSTADLDALYAVFGTSVPPTDALFDLNSDNVVDAADLSEWLSLAATENGHGSPYLRGDTDLDRDVDLSDYSKLAINFDPVGFLGPHGWNDGNFDADNDVDLSDYNALAAGFNPAGYGAAVPEPASVCLLLAGVLLLARVRF